MHQSATPTGPVQDGSAALPRTPSAVMSSSWSRDYRSRVFHCSSVRSRLWRIPVLMPCGHFGAVPGRRGWRDYFRIADRQYRNLRSKLGKARKQELRPRWEKHVLSTFRGKTIPSSSAGHISSMAAENTPSPKIDCSVAATG